MQAVFDLYKCHSVQLFPTSSEAAGLQDSVSLTFVRCGLNECAGSAEDWPGNVHGDWSMPVYCTTPAPEEQRLRETEDP